MIKTENERGSILQSQLLNQQTGIEHFCSTRDCKNPGRGIWMPQQVHGTTIVVVDAKTPMDMNLERQPVDADAVITREKGMWIGVHTADCVPILLYDTQQMIVAAVHAGWRGTVQHIVRLTLQKMHDKMGSAMPDVMAMIGPSISPEAYEVGEDVAEAFVSAGRGDCVLRAIWGPNGKQLLSKPHIDLWQSNVMDMIEAGIDLQHIDCTPWCTFEHYKEIYSARREGIGTGRIVSAIRLKR
ncbi:MAG: peptidoglycan editing factor PgeF [Bacteroidales bacterium]|nr:peptidoglycan editing factor PgeF [Bacteroidales bacterium]